MEGMTHITATDGYKFSMGEAGAALRPETFYYSHRRGGYNGWHYMPVDINKFIQNILPTPTTEDYSYLAEHQYEVGAAYRKAFSNLDHVRVVGVPKGAWFRDREPAFSISAQSAVASWPEPLALQLQFRIQVATSGLTNTNPEKLKYATCARERDIMLETLDSIGVKGNVEVREEEYYQSVLERALDLVRIVKDPNRIFEVGMRAVSCMEMHEVALRALKEAGVLRTSNVFLAQKLDMIPVGTMGHEHVQRYGNDYDAYVAMRDRFPGFLFYLPDTFDAIKSGIPSALQVIAEVPDRLAGIRFDSEHNIKGQYLFTVYQARAMGVDLRLALESGWNRELTIEFEKIREMVEWEASLQAYGYGNFLVKPPWPYFSRDDVSAIYKLCQTGSRPTMKFGDEPGGAKESIPGIPLVYRTSPIGMSEDSPYGYIAQEGEEFSTWGKAYILSGAEADGRLAPIKQKGLPTRLSPETQGLVARCRMDRDATIRG